DSPSIKVELLMDMAEIMKGQDRMTSEDVVNALNQMADRPWGTWKRAKPITQVQVSRLVKGFDIKPTSVRIGDKTPKGYYTQEVVAALSRYAPATEPQHPQHEKNDNQVEGFEDIFVAFQPATEKDTQGRRSATDINGHDNGA